MFSYGGRRVWRAFIAAVVVAGLIGAHLSAYTTAADAAVLANAPLQSLEAGKPVAAGGISSPSGKQLIGQMEQAAAREGTFRERTRTTTLSAGVRDTVTENLDLDLRRHELHQTGSDRTIKRPHTVISQDNFERISIGYNSATRNNGGAWSCQHFRPGQVQLVGRNTFLAGIGWPRGAVNLGARVRHGVQVWQVRATVHVANPDGGQTGHRAIFFKARGQHAPDRDVGFRKDEHVYRCFFAVWAAGDCLVAQRMPPVRRFPLRVVVDEDGTYWTRHGGLTGQRQLLANEKRFAGLTSVACPAVDTCYAVGGATIIATRP